MSKKIIVSSNSGFCFGVKRALDIAERSLRGRKKVYSLGPIIHNPQVVSAFSKKGLNVIKDIKYVSPRGAPLLIPSHGISPNLLGKKNIFYIDTTCPLVNRVQKIVKDLKEKGYFVIIVGNRRHPEVKGLAGIAGRNSRVLKNKKEAKNFNLKAKKIALIPQTTSALADFKEVLSEIAKKNFTELVSFNTVCKNTIDRQKKAASIAGRVDAMIIIGGKNSANTSKLAQTCRKINRNTYHIESKEDLEIKFLKDKKNIGIATGASTPPYAIREVVEKIRRFDSKWLNMKKQ